MVSHGDARTRRLEAKRKWLHDNPEKARAACVRWRAKNRDTARRLCEAWRKNNPDKQKQAMDRWKAANKVKLRFHEKLKRYRRRKVVGTHTFAEWQHVIAYFSGCCAYCLQPMKVITKDHLIPIIAGGSNDVNNLVPACQLCNSRKRTRSLLQCLRDGIFKSS